MGLIGKLTWGRRARVVIEALEEAAAGDGLVAVVGSAALARELEAAGRRVAAVAAARGGGAGAPGSSPPDGIPLPDGACAGLIAAGAGTRADWEPALVEWTRVVRDGGLVVLLDGAPRHELTRRALCAGLVELTQRSAGRTVVTCGRVRKLPAAPR